MYSPVYGEVYQGGKMRRILLVLGGMLWFLPMQGEELPPEAMELLALVKEQPPENWRQEVEVIDRTIEKLTDLRNKELARATSAQNQGDRLQFNSSNLMDARRYWDQADTSREIAKRYQEEIDKLEKRKSEILSEQGIPYTSPSQQLPEGL